MNLYHKQNKARTPAEMYVFGFLTNASVELANGHTYKMHGQISAGQSTHIIEINVSRNFLF